MAESAPSSTPAMFSTVEQAWATLRYYHESVETEPLWAIWQRTPLKHPRAR